MRQMWNTARCTDLCACMCLSCTTWTKLGSILIWFLHCPMSSRQFVPTNLLMAHKHWKACVGTSVARLVGAQPRARGEFTSHVLVERTPFLLHANTCKWKLGKLTPPESMIVSRIKLTCSTHQLLFRVTCVCFPVKAQALAFSIFGLRHVLRC